MKRNLVVIPAYNEEEALPATLADLASLSDEFELLVVDDGSTDRTSEIVARAQRESSQVIHSVRLPVNCGIGAAVQTGYRFAASRGGYRYVIQCDADGQHDAAAIVRLVEACDAGDLDLCIGSRFLEPDSDGFRSTPLRRVGIRFFSWLIGALTGARVTDPTSGLRCASEAVWRRFAERYPDDYPEPESLFWCVRHGFRVGETPVQMRARHGGASSIGRIRSVYYMMKVTFAILIEIMRSRERPLE